MLTKRRWLQYSSAYRVPEDARPWAMTSLSPLLRSVSILMRLSLYWSVFLLLWQNARGRIYFAYGFSVSPQSGGGVRWVGGGAEWPMLDRKQGQESETRYPQ